MASLESIVEVRGKVVIIRVLLFTLTFLVVFGAWLSLKQGVADSRAEDVRQSMLIWRADSLDAAFVRQAYDSMLQANELDPFHPTYLHRLGRLSHVLMSLEQVNREEWAELSKSYYRQSLAVRPSWALTWANLALIKADLLEFDAEMDSALTNATTLGPWEPGVLVIVADIATTKVQFLGRTMLPVMAASVIRGLRSPERRTAAKVEKLVNGAALNSETISALEDFLVTNDWGRNTDQLMLVALQYYDVWRPTKLKIIRDKLVREALKSPHSVRFLIEKNRLVQICPYLPRTPRLQKACKRI